MSTFIILLHDPEIEDVSTVVEHLDHGINELGLLGGNFLVEKTDDDPNGKAFWEEWKRRTKEEKEAITNGS